MWGSWARVVLSALDIVYDTDSRVYRVQMFLFWGKCASSSHQPQRGVKGAGGPLGWVEETCLCTCTEGVDRFILCSA